ncbi:hypothetical protein [Lactobacillus helveticus]|uniref:hypothetical protein n=1 Tax=Lactobacillus helveticus TaxID=1587 RepID=UPI001D0F9C4F|nr:hypothetical protein [Lactobacillus helveticus]
MTFSTKYLRYQRQIRQGQIDRAIKQANSKQKNKRNNPSAPGRFIKEKHFTKEGEKANQVQYLIDKERIKKEEMFDGFYGICTDLEASPLELIKINKNRWENRTLLPRDEDRVSSPAGLRKTRGSNKKSLFGLLLSSAGLSLI